MRRYEYFQETAEDISGDNWEMLLEKHGSQGWELISVILKDTYRMNYDALPEVKQSAVAANMQTLYIIIFKREY